jgi:hypothetical protein
MEFIKNSKTEAIKKDGCFAKKKATPRMKRPLTIACHMKNFWLISGL